MAGTTAKQRLGFGTCGDFSLEPGRSSLTVPGLAEGKHTWLFGFRALLLFGCTAAGPAVAACQTCGATMTRLTDGRSWLPWHQAGCHRHARIMLQCGMGPARHSGCMAVTTTPCSEICGLWMLPASVGLKWSLMEAQPQGQAMLRCGMTPTAGSGYTAATTAS